MADEPIRTRRWKRQEYDQLIEKGFFQPGDKVELIGGHLMVAEPQGSRHATGIRLVVEALRSVFGQGWNVSVQLPIALDDESEPEPDVSVVPGSAGDYRDAHPSRPVLVVEIAETSLAIDRGLKLGVYARGGVPDYWIVNLVDNVLDVYRRPSPNSGAPHGWTYADTRLLRRGEIVSPLARSEARLSVADLLL
jgi:Uma2 family endonuclease